MKNNIKFQKYIYNIWHKHISFDDNKFVIHNKNKQQQKKQLYMWKMVITINSESTIHEEKTDVTK